MDPESEIRLLKKQMEALELITGVLLDHISHPVHFPAFIPMTGRELGVDMNYYFEKAKAAREAFREKANQK